MLSYVFGTKDNGYNTSLDMLTGGLGNVMTIDQPSWEWNVMIDADRAVTKIARSSTNRYDIAICNGQAEQCENCS